MNFTVQHLFHLFRPSTSGLITLEIYLFFPQWLLHWWSVESVEVCNRKCSLDLDNTMDVYMVNVFRRMYLWANSMKQSSQASCLLQKHFPITPSAIIHEPMGMTSKWRHNTGTRSAEGEEDRPKENRFTITFSGTTEQF